jgi:hypothetical protein
LIQRREAIVDSVSSDRKKGVEWKEFSVIDTEDIYGSDDVLKAKP